MGSAQNAGRVGAWAVTIWLGAAIATPGIALAQPAADTGSVDDSSSSTSASAATPGRSAESTSRSESTGTEPTRGTPSTPGPVDSDSASASRSDSDDVESATAPADEDVAGAADGDGPLTAGDEDSPGDEELSTTEDEVQESSAIGSPGQRPRNKAGSPGDSSVDAEITEPDPSPLLTPSPGRADESTDVDSLPVPAPLPTVAVATVAPDEESDAAAGAAALASVGAAPAAAAAVQVDSSVGVEPFSSIIGIFETPIVAVWTVWDTAMGGVQTVLEILGGGDPRSLLAFPLALVGIAREEVQTFLFYDILPAPTPTSVPQGPNLLVNPGAEVGDPSLSGTSSVSIPGWEVVGTPTVIKYGTPRPGWPLGIPFPMPNLPFFMDYPSAASGPADGGAQFFGGGYTGLSTLTQTVDLSAAAANIDAGTVTYQLSAALGGYLVIPATASVKVDFLDANKAYLGTANTGEVGVLNRLGLTGFKQRYISGLLPEKTRFAQVTINFEPQDLIKIGVQADYNTAFVDNVSFTISDLAVAAPPAIPTPKHYTGGPLDHVFMVYMENKGFSDIYGSPNAPFINSLINAYGFATNYYGLTHPSLPNYYPVIGGSDYGITYNCGGPCIDAPNTLVKMIDDTGTLTWRGYAQSMVAGQPLVNQGDYSLDEWPFPAFKGIGDNPAYAEQHLFPLEQMAIDLESPATAPHFVWFAANEDFNGEGPIDFPFGMLQFAFGQLTPSHQYNVPALDQFLSETVTTILSSNTWSSADKSVLIVTFDEDNNNTSLGFGDEDNHIVTVVIPSPAAVAAGMRGGHFIATERYDHYSLLRFIEDSLGLGRLTNNDKYANPMNEFWV